MNHCVQNVSKMMTRDQRWKWTLIDNVNLKSRDLHASLDPSARSSFSNSMIGNLFAGLVRYDFCLFGDCATAAAPKWLKNE